MSKQSKSPKTLEEKRLIARSQMADDSAILLCASSNLATALGWRSARLSSEFPIASTQLTNGDITIQFLYGPPEFHVEMLLWQRRHPNVRISLSELIQHPPVRAWMQARASNPPIAKASRIESEMLFFSELLRGPCAEVFTAPASFFSRLLRDDRKA